MVVSIQLLLLMLYLHQKRRKPRARVPTASGIRSISYDYAGRRFEKKVTTKGGITTHHRYLYRGYLQIAAVNLKEDASTPDLPSTSGGYAVTSWFLIWDPTQPVATRPLAIRKDGTWYTYGWDLTKNVCELYGQQGYIRTIYRYSPYGTVIAEGNVEQVIQWSSEYYDSETALVYYNYRYYNPLDGRWTRRDLISILNLMEYCLNAPISFYDVLGTWVAGTQAGAESTDWRGHSDMGQLPGMDYAKEDFGENGPFKKPGLHFMNLVEVEPMLLEAVKSCNKDSFESNMHRMQDFFSHYSQGYRWPETLGHIFRSSYPDNPDAHKEQFDRAISRTEQWERRWLTCCCRKKDGTWTRRDENDQQCGGITIPSNDYKIEPSIGEINWNASQYEEKAMHEAYKEMIRRNNTNIKNNAERMEESIRKVPINVKYTHPWYGL